jgi:predicted metal-dependent phosphoesterase TrpH
MTRIRVAAHVHSEWSYDGAWTLPDLARAFSRRGYRAVLLAEHDRGWDAERLERHRAACREVSTDKILLVPGVEYSDAGNTVHVPVWGEELPFLGEGLPTPELLDRVAAVGGQAVIAHPGRRNVVDQLDESWLERLIGVELWNRKYDGYAPNRAAAELLSRRTDLVPFVSLDFHTARQFHPLAMVLDVIGDPSEASICEALRNRRARPTAYRVPAMQLAHGPVSPAICRLERSRKVVASRVRRARARRQGVSG